MTAERKGIDSSRLHELNIQARTFVRDLERTRSTYFYPQGFWQKGSELEVEPTADGKPPIFVMLPEFSEPLPLAVSYFHDDSDDDPFAVEAYDIDELSGFCVDPETGNRVSVFQFRSEGIPPIVSEEVEFYRLKDGEVAGRLELEPCELFDREQSCLRVSLRQSQFLRQPSR